VGQAVLHPLARQRLALGLNGDAHGLGEDDPVDDAAVVVDRADPALLDVAMARAMDVLQDLLDHGEVAAARVEGGRDVPRGRVAGRPDVLLGAAPPDAPEVIDREAVLLRLLEGRRARLSPVPLERVVRPVVAGDVDPGRALLDARRRQREVPELEAPLAREPLEDGIGSRPYGTSRCRRAIFLPLIFSGRPPSGRRS